MAEIVIYVSPGGSDSNPGTERHPVGSIRAALAKTRLRHFDSKRIVLRGGPYYDVHLTLTEEDSGLAIEAYPGETPVLYGGLPVSAWDREGEFVTARLPGIKERTRDFRVLEVNGGIRPRARLPETGSFFHRNRFDVRWMSTQAGGWERKPTEEELSVLRFAEGDLGPWLDPNNAELTIYHEWDESLVGLKGIDPVAGTLTFSNLPGHPPGAFADRNPNARAYVVWNVKEGMTRPGQWYLDRTNGRLIYYPLPSETEGKLHVVAPTREQIIQLEQGAERLRFHGITLACSAAERTAGGFGASGVSAAVVGEQVRDIAFERMTVRHTGGWAFRLKGERIRIEGCHIHHTGAGGIHADGKGFVLAECRLHNIGQTYQSAVAVMCGGSRHRICRNDIRHTPYSGIVVCSDDTSVDRNRFEDVMTFMKDGAAVYCTGVRGVTVGGNAVFSEPGRKLRSYAYYLDELCENCTVGGNLAVHSGMPVLSHMTRNCRIADNLFLDEGPQVISGFNTFGLVFERNVLVAESIEIQAPRGNPDGVESEFDLSPTMKMYSSADGIVSLQGNRFDSRSGRTVLQELVQYRVIREFPVEGIAGGNVFAPLGRGELDDRLQSFADAGCSGSSDAEGLGCSSDNLYDTRGIGP